MDGNVRRERSSIRQLGNDLRAETIKNLDDIPQMGAVRLGDAELATILSAASHAIANKQLAAAS